MELPNYVGRTLHLEVDRRITLLEDGQVEQGLSVTIPEGVSSVAYATENKITNRNDFEVDRRDRHRLHLDARHVQPLGRGSDGYPV